ncbi:uncharacterized protein LOC111243475 isoform X1 [Varroa destructor]|uniref:Uncharacterized protein n=2 Tax=Varroa destructor TaxID=109461 RepID=A0A7M7IZU1_VARDE|nr:uncharacterized protein LOC111243475 isoform X1 [Varroa destructor]
MVLRRPGTIHRKISMNSNMELRKSKKFKLRMKAKRQRAGIKKKEVRVAPEDVGILSKKAIKSRTRVNPLANIKLSNKKRNKILKQRRYQEREREAAEQEPGTSNADEMEVEKAHKRNLTAQKSAEPMECK